uniref:Integrase, catalytic region, zinc finger, CCHC-type, peptidase aspartic, catalytic n=1 Tax=Tanacetum cinerariifolium TaxID=118510 RepID=A0A699HMV3_TANCI|nr:hypothetical protein [Tanacetum cinerariifolium]
MVLVLMAKEFKLNDTTPTNNNQTSLSNPCNRQIVQLGMNMGQDRKMLMVEYIGIANQNRNGNVVAARAEGNARIQLQSKEFDFMAAEGAYEEIEEVNMNCTLMKNLQQALTSEEQYIDLLKSSTEPHLVQHNDNNVMLAESSMDPSEGTVEQHPATVEETHAFFESLYNNLVMEVEKFNTINRKLKEANVDLTTELSRHKGSEKCFEFNKVNFDELENGYRKSVYQEQCLTKKINAIHLSSAKQITTLNEEIANLNNQVSKEKTTITYLQEERNKLMDDFKIHEDELLDKIIQSEKKIKEFDNILVKMGQSIQTIHMLSRKPDSVLLEKHDPPVMYDTEETLQLAQESRLKIKQLNKEIKSSSTAHQEVHKILKDEIAHIVNQVDARVINFEKQFLKEATKFDFKSLANEANESLGINKVLEYENERLLREVVVEKNDLIKPATSYSVLKSQESNIMKYDKVIAPRTFRINPLKNTRVDNFVPNKHVKASVRTKSIIVSQPYVITKKDVNSNTLNHTSPVCNNIKLAIQDDNSEVICATCKQCLITVNHDECVFKYVNGMNSSKKNQSANVSESKNQKKHQENVKKSKKLGFEERHASSMPSKPRTCLRWLPTGRIFDLYEKITASNNTKSESDTSVIETAEAEYMYVSTCCSLNLSRDGF